jgi:apolipoprotein N-acyltransferase
MTDLLCNFADVKAGPDKIPTYDSEYGKLAGSICFDMDFPTYIRQAGVQETGWYFTAATRYIRDNAWCADIMLQPSWTWNAINSRHFTGDAVRTIENGFTLFRCSSNGESGIVSPLGEIKARTYTGNNPNYPALFQLPLQHRQATMYTAVGFIFEWICLVASIFYYLMVLLPKETVLKSTRELCAMLGNPETTVLGSNSGNIN